MYRYHLTKEAYGVWYKLHTAFWDGSLEDCDFVQIALFADFKGF